MSLPGLSISRHVLAASLSLVIVLAGLVGYSRLGVDRMPNIDVPMLTVMTPVSGLAPETVAQTVTERIESTLNTVQGIDEISSRSSRGLSTVTIRFQDGVNMQDAFSDVQSKLQQAARALPEDADTPTIRKIDMGAQPVVWLALSGDQGILDLTRKAIDVRRAVESIDGVGQAEVVGGIAKVMRVTVDDAKLAAHSLTFADISAAFQKNHIQGAGGKLKIEGRDFQVKLDLEFADAATLARMPLAVKDGATIRLGDVATVDIAEEDTRTFARYEGKSSVAISITKVSGSNTVAVIDRVLERVNDQIKPNLGSGYELTVASEEGGPIRAVVNSLEDHLLEGTLLTAFIVWFFLKSVRATLIVATAIPVSLAGAVAAMYFMGYTFNSFTLLAMLLLIGVVVDDAIVVLEAIYHQREVNPGLSAREAAERGSRLVMFAVMAATLTLVCIFAPVTLMDGMLGRVFKSFAVVVTLGVMVSWFVSMTLTPMLASRYLKVSHSAEGPVARRLEVALRAIDNTYRATLSWSLSHRKTVLLAAGASLLPAFVLLGSVDKAFVPDANDGRISVGVDVPAGLPKEELLRKMGQLESILREDPKVDTVLTSFREGGANGTERASLTVTMVPGTEQQQGAAMAGMQAKLSKVVGVKAQVTRGSSSGGGGGGGLRFVLRGPDYQKLVAASVAFTEQLQAIPGLESMKSDASLAAPQAAVRIDRAAAARLGVSASDVAAAVGARTGAATLGRYLDEDGERYQVVLRSVDSDKLDAPEDLTNTYVRGINGELIRLSDVASLVMEGGPNSVSRVSQQYAVTFSGSPSIAQGTAMQLVEEAAKSLPEDITLAYSGQSKEFAKVGKTLGMTLLMAVVLLYFVLASQFNSYTQPFLVMLAQPLAVIGGVGGLWLTGHSLNMYSMIGLILLLGLVAKNSILLVDRANQLRDEGMASHEAIAQASPERLRPVLMTSLTVILTMLPASFGLGAGAENNGPMAVAIIGGMVSSTLLTLVVVPAAYSLFVRGKPHAA